MGEEVAEPVAEVAEGEAEKTEEAQPVKPKRKRAAPNAEKQSKYIGVHWSNKERKWLASRSVNGKSYFGGTYESELEAARQSDNLLAFTEDLRPREERTLGQRLRRRSSSD